MFAYGHPSSSYSRLTELNLDVAFARLTAGLVCSLYITPRIQPVRRSAAWFANSFSFSVGTNAIVPLVPMDHLNCPIPSPVTWENNLSPLNEMHIHQQNHWNDIIFYWYQSYHWYQWTIGIALYPARSHGKII